MKLVKGILLIYGLCLFEPAEGLLRKAAVVADHTHIGIKNGGALVDLDGALEQLVCLIELLLLQVYVAQAPPCVVVSFIS